MFNFYVVLAGYDMVTDANMPPRAGANSKPHHYKQKVQKMEGSSEKNFHGKTV